MGCSCWKFKKSRGSSVINKKKITLLVLGLDNAGKSTVIRRISKTPLDDVLPTVGFAVTHLNYRGCNVTLYDVGGGPKIRGIWKQYYADAHGIIFVVDSGNIRRIEECRRALISVLTHPTIARKPLLLLGNKQDVPGALDEIDIVDKLQLEGLVNQQKCPTLVELCAAAGTPDKKDFGIKNGFRWILRNICKDYPTLNNRVLVDMALEEEMEQKVKAQRRCRPEQVESEQLENVTILRNDERASADLTPYICDNHRDDFKPVSPVLVEERQPENGKWRNSNSEDDSDNDVVIVKSSHSELFFKSHDWSSTAQLLDGLSTSLFKNSLQRPKSSGAIEFPVLKKRKKKRKLRGFKNNKTAPQSGTEWSLTTVTGPIPAIFDPSYSTEVTEIASGNSVSGKSLQMAGRPAAHTALKRESTVARQGEMLLDVTNLSL